MHNGLPSRETVRRVREKYPPGCRVELVQIYDPYTKLQPGDLGTVESVDDIGTVFVAWDSGSRLGVAWGEDKIRRV